MYVVLATGEHGGRHVSEEDARVGSGCALVSGRCTQVSGVSV
jgi:hypothetical protein